MNPWIWRIVIIILAVAFVPIIVSGTASLIGSAIHSVSDGVNNLFRPFSQSGNAKLEGIIQLCLYLISIGLLARLIIRK
jgi:hypothetical protein